MNINRNQLSADLHFDEGERLKPYIDTVGKITIGVGRNLSDVGISTTESEVMLQNDIDIVLAELNLYFGWVADHPESIQRALANMLFNMGIVKLQGFKNFLAFLQARKYLEASEEMLHSKWATQVGSRAYRLSQLVANTNAQSSPH